MTHGYVTLVNLGPSYLTLNMMVNLGPSYVTLNMTVRSQLYTKLTSYVTLDMTVNLGPSYVTLDMMVNLPSIVCDTEYDG